MESTATDRVRLVSHSEIGSLQGCSARWDFAYGDQLAGSSLSSRSPAILLREGSAWGAAVAAWHASAGVHPISGRLSAVAALHASLDEDAAKQIAAGTYDADEHAGSVAHLTACLDHYIATTGERLGLFDMERDLRAPIIERPGWEFQALIDGLRRDESGNLWGVEFKFRKTLTPYAEVTRWPQLRWYAWALSVVLDEPVVGFLVDERLNASPAPVAFNKDGGVSKVQSCTAAEYVAAFDALAHGEANLSGKGVPLKSQTCHPYVYASACAEAGVEVDDAVHAKLRARYYPDAEVLDGLKRKAWQVRHVVVFTDAEIAGAGLDAASMAQLIAFYDRGTLRPVRNPGRGTCPMCSFRDICPTPRDADLVEALFERRVAKRDRVDAEPLTDPNTETA